MSRAPLSALVAGLVILLSACTAPRSAPVPLEDTDYPGPLRSPTLIAEDVLLQQRVTARWDRGGHAGTRGFDAALQKQGDTLTLVGLSPLGTTGFVIRLADTAVEIRNETGEPLPFPARFILIDVQRVFWPWLDAADAPDDGRLTGVVDGERVEQIYAGGRLVERRFERVDARPPGTIRVTYHWQTDDGSFPARAVLRNDWFGYELDIETRTRTPLPPRPPGGG
jgi:hypothetical protein